MRIWVTSISGKQFEFHEKERNRIFRMLRKVWLTGSTSSRKADEELSAYDLITTSSPNPSHVNESCRHYNHQALTERGAQLMADLQRPFEVDVKAVLDAKFAEYTA